MRLAWRVRGLPSLRADGQEGLASPDVHPLASLSHILLSFIACSLQENRSPCEEGGNVLGSLSSPLLPVDKQTVAVGPRSLLALAEGRDERGPCIVTEGHFQQMIGSHLAVGC